MAKYLLSLSETIDLFTPAQKEKYYTLLRSAVPSNFSEDFVRSFFLKFRDREPQAGTPGGFLLDLEESVMTNKIEITNIFDLYNGHGYFTVKYNDRQLSDTEKPNLTTTVKGSGSSTRTPNLTQNTTDNGNDERKPNLTDNTTHKRVYSNTPDSSGVVSGNYATDVTSDTDNRTSAGNETTTHTNNIVTNSTGNEKTVSNADETRTESGTRSRIVSEDRETVPIPVYELTSEFPNSLMTRVLLLFSDCFMLLY